jgi:hypothetical protein
VVWRIEYFLFNTPNDPTESPLRDQSVVGLLFNTSNEIVTLITDNLAFFSDHRVAALGTGVKKFFGFIDGRIVFDPPAEVQQGVQGSNFNLLFRIVFAHKPIRGE